MKYILLIAFLLIATPVIALSPTRELIKQIQSQESHLEYLYSLACSRGVVKYCEVEELPGVSEVHTVMISFPVTASFYNNEQRQNDITPNEGAFGNVIDSYNRGENPIAVSQDLTPYPLRGGDRVMLKYAGNRAMCIQYAGEKTVMDHLNARYRNSVDILIPCDGKSGDADYCMRSRAKANAVGTCQYMLYKL